MNGNHPEAKNIKGATGEGGVQSFIKQQQELAINKLAQHLPDTHRCEEAYTDLDTLIQQIIQNTGEELMRLAPCFENTKTGEVAYYAGVKEYIARIKNITNVTVVK